MRVSEGDEITGQGMLAARCVCVLSPSADGAHCFNLCKNPAVHQICLVRKVYVKSRCCLIESDCSCIICTKVAFASIMRLQLSLYAVNDTRVGTSYRGRYWSGIRAACEPVFHSDKLQTYVPVANKSMTSLVDKLSAAQSQGPVQINLALAGMTMDVIGGSAFG